MGSGQDSLKIHSARKSSVGQAGFAQEAQVKDATSFNTIAGGTQVGKFRNVASKGEARAEQVKAKVRNFGGWCNHRVA